MFGIIRGYLKACDKTPFLKLGDETFKPIRRVSLQEDSHLSNTPTLPFGTHQQLFPKCYITWVVADHMAWWRLLSVFLAFEWLLHAIWLLLAFWCLQPHPSLGASLSFWKMNQDLILSQSINNLTNYLHPWVKKIQPSLNSSNPIDLLTWAVSF